MAFFIALRSRLVPRLLKLRSSTSRLLSTEASSSSKAAPGLSAAKQALFSDLHHQLPPHPEALVKERKGLKFLSNVFLWALTGATAAVGYISYAYTLDEVNHKTKSFRESAFNTQPAFHFSDDIHKYQAMLYSAAIKVPARAIDMYLELRESVEEHVKSFAEPVSEKLLPDLHPAEQDVIYTLVLDLNETLLYTDWKRERGWRTFKRPGVDAFLDHLSQFYEIVLYSDQMDMYVMSVCEKLDPNYRIRYRLARNATKYENGKHYRDLSKLNRNPKKIIYISGNAFDTSLQPENCVPVKPYKLESDDTSLVDLIPFLEYVARSNPADIRPVLASYERKDVAKEFIERSIEYQKRMEGQRQGRFWRR